MQHTNVGDLPFVVYQNIENVVLTEVPKLMIDASELVLTPIIMTLTPDETTRAKHTTKHLHSTTIVLNHVRS